VKILHVTADFAPKWGGVYQVVASLAKELQKNSEVSIFATYREHMNQSEAIPGVRHFYLETSSKYQFSFAIKKQLEELIPEYDLIHIHGLWQFPLSYSATVARAKKIPYVYHIHGMLDPWALSFHPVRKKVYSAIWERKNLNGAAKIICLTENEEKYVRKFGVASPTVVIPNGIERSFADHLPAKKQFSEKHPEFLGKYLVLFLGRIHPKKGIELLIRALQKLSQLPAKIHLIIAGPEEDKAYTQNLKTLVSSLQLEKNITFFGEVYGESKKELLIGADLFVLPSHDEAFSISILEAMVCNLPVVVTKNCNFPEVERFQAGFVIPHNLDHLVDVMSNIIVDEKAQTQMGANGRKLVLANYHWDAIALRLLQAYRQVLDKQLKNK